MTTSNGLLRLGPDREPVPLEIAASYRARTRGLLGRDGIPGAALLLTPAGSVHTFRMRFAIDVAYLDRRLRVIALTTMPPAGSGSPAPLPARPGGRGRGHDRLGPARRLAAARRRTGRTGRTGPVSTTARPCAAPAVGWGG